MFSKVVFPAPLAPMIAVTWPALKIPLIPLRISFFFVNFLKGRFDFFYKSGISTE
jgi:hypothetical protein